MTKLINSDLSLTFVVEGDDAVDSFLSFLKANGLKAGKKPIAELLDGKRDEVAGFYLVAEDSVELPSDDEAEAAADTAEVAAPVVAPKASDADEKPAFDASLVDSAVAEFLAKGGPVVTSKPAETAAPAPVRAKVEKVVKACEPKGKVKPVRKGTKIANGLEALLSGVTAEALLAVNIGDDLVDFCNRRVTKRGYGIALLEGGVIKLVLPEGATAIAFS